MVKLDKMSVNRIPRNAVKWLPKRRNNWNNFNAWDAREILVLSPNCAGITRGQRSGLVRYVQENGLETGKVGAFLVMELVSDPMDLTAFGPLPRLCAKTLLRA